MHARPASETSDHIQVVVRVRPFNNAESTAGGISGFSFLNTETCELAAQRFTFDRVFAPHEDQETIFDERFKEKVDHALDGFNSSIIAYGQTAAGKSYTMTGGDTARTHGIIPRAIARIYANTSETVEATFIELYNDRLQDLFNNRDAVIMQGDGSLKNARIIRASSRTQLMSAIQRANGLRAVASTNMNSQSSRSHAVLQLKLGSQHNNAKLVFVDLAGSESAAKAGTSGTKLGEAAKINTSLTVLFTVIQALSSRLSHIPYRDSKLTQLLRDSIGGNSKTVLIVNCSPSTLHERESLNSLRFGSRAKLVENQVQSTEELESLAKVHIWQQQLKRELQQWELYGTVPSEKWTDIAELAALDAYNAPHVPDPYGALLKQHESLNENNCTELKALELEAEALKEQISAMDKENAELELSLGKCQADEADGAASAATLFNSQIRKLHTALYHCRMEHRLVLRDIAVATALTSDEKCRRYLNKVNEACEQYASQFLGQRYEPSLQQASAKRARSCGSSMSESKLRRTSTTA